jgi:hypothetical protein
VSISESVVAVGASGESSSAGAVYVYTFSSSLGDFEFSIRLPPSQLSAGSLFGQAVSVYQGTEVFIPGATEAGTVAIGAPGVNGNQGAVYLYVTNDVTVASWSLQSNVTVTDASTRFGGSVSLYTDALAVGAIASSGAGVVYTFALNTTTNKWTQLARLQPAEGSNGDGFASSISLYRELTSGLNALVLIGGAPSVNAAYVFLFDPRVSRWSQNAVLIPPAGSVQFGHSVSAYEATLAVGDPQAAGGLGGVSTFIAFNSSNRVRWALQSQVSLS